MNKLHPEIVAEGSDLMAHFYDASIRKAITGLGAGKEYDPKDFPERFRPYIDKYIHEEWCAVELCYIAMRAKEKELYDSGILPTIE